MRFLLLVIVLSVFKLNAQSEEKSLHDLNTLLIETVMHDLYTPIVASRIYVYPNIAFYECIRFKDESLTTLKGKLNGLDEISTPDKNEKIDYWISACVSFSRVAKSLVASEYKFAKWETAFIDSLVKVKDQKELKSSMDFGYLIADQIISWSKSDNYIESRGLSRFTIKNDPGSWQPTPLEYASALEPNWNTIRPMTLKTPSQFSPTTKLVYSDSKNSLFYKNVKEVYETVNNLDTLQKEIALYWDDNPNVMQNIGHLEYFIHKISPGGHWLMIGQQACIQKGVSVTKSSQVYALTSIAIFDAFIACWDEKYATNLIRPITIINRILDKDWNPYLQTPPFPEFTSGHGVISNTAATVLTKLLGEDYSFTDEVEIPFGLKPRNYKSFNEAAYEACWSRVYGGIHYPETARISIIQGQQIGNYILNKLYP